MVAPALGLRVGPVDVHEPADMQVAARRPLPVAARARAADSWHGTRHDTPFEALPAAFAKHCRARPDAIAVRQGERSWSYAELDSRADGIASRLREVGIGADALVGVALDRTPDMVAGLLAIMRLGAAYLPLDPAFPRARLDDIVGDARPAALLTQGHVAASLPDWGMASVLVDAPEPALRPRPSAAPDDVAPHTLAYVLYTSGSTGRPKGVAVSHGALMNLLAAMREAPGFTARDRLLAVTTLSFDIAALELFLPLLCGGEVIVAPREAVVDTRQLAALIDSARPSVVQATPATWRALIEAGWQGGPHLTLLCGGEMLQRGLADRLLTRCGALWNMYGPTETTIWSLIHRVTPGDGPVPIGRPIANTSIHILDEGGQAVPTGQVGELFIGGAGLALGYYRRPGLTAERFAVWPAAPGVRLYRTGDFARTDDVTGAVICLGRRDSEEKIRGFRVAVEEVEGALAAHPAIAAAAVRGWPAESGGRMLAAYLVAKEGTMEADMLTAPELRAHLARLLPEYMIPSRFDYLAALPMTPNRKVDRAALPQPRPIVRTARFEPPQGETEERLAAIWRELLGVAEVDRNDSFFDLGGHSLLVARLLRRVERDFGRTIGLSMLFQAHRLREMARMVGARGTFAEPGLVALQPEGSRPPLLWLNAGPTFRPLSECLGPDQPFLGVPVGPILEREAGRAPELRAPEFHEVAAHVAAAIRSARPHGPYPLGGWCTSGVLAFEVARQLRAAGEDVPLVVLVDAVGPETLRAIGALALRWSQLRFHFRELLRQQPGRRTAYLRDRLNGMLEDLELLRLRLTGESDETRRAALERLCLGYQAQEYLGDVVLFQPQQRVAVLDGAPGWAEVVRGRLAVHEIPGGHRTMLEHPHVEELAAKLREALRGDTGPPAAR